jgi:hypothetical protein
LMADQTSFRRFISDQPLEKKISLVSKWKRDLFQKVFFIFSFCAENQFWKSEKSMIRKMKFCLAKQRRGLSSWTGWPDEFVKISPKMWPNPFFVKINTYVTYTVKKVAQ